ncbi:MAG: hypothetical protein KAH17_07265 [Bacteroidales bacterium]|nr:hypothetical protein [Bacteroidales bacterium]
MKRLLLLLGFFGIFGSASTQESTDYGFFLGMSQEHLQTIMPVPKAGSVMPAIGAFYRYNLNSRYGLRGGINYGLATGAGLNSLDIHGLFEFNFLPLNPTLEKPKVSTFVAAGLGLYQIEPVMAFNVGVKYRLTERIGFSVEWDLRRKIIGADPDTDTYVLPSNWYSHIGVTASYNIIKTCKTCPFYESNRKKNR